MPPRAAVLLALLPVLLLLGGRTAEANEGDGEEKETESALESRFPPPRLPPRHRLLLNHLTVARANPIGLEHQLRAGWQRRLFVSEAALFRDNFFFAGVLPRLNPAFTRVGPAVEIQPLSILNLRASAEYVRFFSTFGYLQSFPSPTVNYSDTRLAELADDDAAYAASGFHASLEPTFQIKIGSTVIRNKFALDYWDMDLRAGDTVFYEATLDTLLPGSGYNVANDFDILRVTDYGLTAGLRHTFVRPIYREGDFDEGDDRGWVRNRHHRLGALVAYTFHDRGYTKFNRPTVLLVTSWYLSHRWRTGRDVDRVVPYVVLGFAFQTDLLDYEFDP